MRTILSHAVIAGVLALGLFAGVGVAVGEATPEVCPQATPGGEALDALVGQWHLVSHDGDEPSDAWTVRFMEQGKAEVRIANNPPIAATYGTNCCGYLVLNPTPNESEEQGPAPFATLIAEFEVQGQTLTLFAKDGDWVFSRATTTTTRGE